jgi:hypothetical protein
MSWYENTFVKTIKALAEHTGAVIVAALCFWLVGFVMKAVLHPGWIRAAIDGIEDLGLIVLMLWFFVQMLRQLYDASKGGSDDSRSLFVA